MSPVLFLKYHRLTHLIRNSKSCQISLRVCHCSQTELGKKGNYLENNLTPRTMSAPLQSVTILILQKSTIETQLALIVSSEAQLLGSGDILRSCTFSWSSVIKRESNWTNNFFWAKQQDLKNCQFSTLLAKKLIQWNNIQFLTFKIGRNLGQTS